MIRQFKAVIRNVARRAGFDITAYNYTQNHDLRRAKILRDLGISLVVDAGANEGQYGRLLRRNGYQRKIVSFEPVNRVFLRLQETAATDPYWKCHDLALAERDGEATIHVAEMTTVSSLLSPTGIGAVSEWGRISPEMVRLRRLDTVLPSMLADDDNIWLKLDVQGYEQNVLDGAQALLPRIVAIETEMSLSPLYAGEMLMPEMLSWLDRLGFIAVSLHTACKDVKSGHVLQVDGIFLRKSR